MGVVKGGGESSLFMDTLEIKIKKKINERKVYSKVIYALHCKTAIPQEFEDELRNHVAKSVGEFIENKMRGKSKEG